MTCFIRVFSQVKLKISCEIVYFNPFFIVQSEHVRWNWYKIDIISLFFPLYFEKIAMFATYFISLWKQFWSALFYLPCFHNSIQFPLSNVNMPDETGIEYFFFHLACIWKRSGFHGKISIVAIFAAYFMKAIFRKVENRLPKQKYGNGMGFLGPYPSFSGEQITHGNTKSCD